jgi:hypothetical protein
MSNSKLEGKKFVIPNEILEHLKKTLSSYKGDENVRGYERLNTLIKDGEVTYYVMKRIKNYFDSYVGDKYESEYLLNGGDKMKFWVDSTLNKAREFVNNEISGYVENPIKQSRNTDRTQSIVTQLKNVIKENRNSYRFIVNESQYKFLIKKLLLK